MLAIDQWPQDVLLYSNNTCIIYVQIRRTVGSLLGAAHHVFGVVLLLEKDLLGTIIDFISICGKLLNKPEAVKGCKLFVVSAVEDRCRGIWQATVATVTRGNSVSALIFASAITLMNQASHNLGGPN